LRQERLSKIRERKLSIGQKKLVSGTQSQNFSSINFNSGDESGGEVSQNALYSNSNY
jgi:hypothetical protein